MVIKNTSFHMPGQIASNDGPMTLQIIIDNADFPFKGTEKPTQEDEVPVRRECNAEKEFHAELEWGGEQAPEYSARDQGATGSADKVLELKPEDVEDEEANEDEMMDVVTEHA